jgi:hypothetical protein
MFHNLHCDYLYRTREVDKAFEALERSVKAKEDALISIREPPSRSIRPDPT